MFFFPLYWILAPYIVFLAIFIVFVIVEIYHLLEAGAYNIKGFFVTFLVIALAVANLAITWFLLSDIDWQEPIVIL